MPNNPGIKLKAFAAGCATLLAFLGCSKNDATLYDYSGCIAMRLPDKGESLLIRFVKNGKNEFIAMEKNPETEKKVKKWQKEGHVDINQAEEYARFKGGFRFLKKEPTIKAFDEFLQQPLECDGLLNGRQKEYDVSVLPGDEQRFAFVSPGTKILKAVVKWPKGIALPEQGKIWTAQELFDAKYGWPEMAKIIRPNTIPENSVYNQPLSQTKNRRNVYE